MYNDIIWIGYFGSVSCCMLLVFVKGGDVPRASPYKIVLSALERDELESRSRRYTAPYFEVVRAKIVLMAAAGLRNDEIAARLDTPRQVVSKWRKRFHEQRLAGLDDLPRAGRPPDLPPGRGRGDQDAGM